MRHVCLIENLLPVKPVFFTITLLMVLGYFTPILAQNGNIKSDIKVGVYQNPPKIFTNEKGEPDGLFIDLLEAIAEDEKLTLHYTTGEWTELMNMLSNGDIDLMPDVAYSSERDSLYTLSSLPILGTWLEIFTTEGTNINSIFDISNKKIGVLKGSIQEEYLQTTIQNKLDLEFELIVFPNYETSAEALNNGKIDLLVADRFFYFSKLYNRKITRSGVIFRPTDLHLAFPKNTNPALVKLFDQRLSKYKNDPGSQYYEILNHWYDKEVDSEIPDYIKWLLVIIGIILVMVIIFSMILRYRVKVQTRTLWKKNRQLTRAKEKAVESEHLKTIFLQNMSHEIRTPMNGILGFLELLKEPDLDSDSRRKYIDIVIKSGQRLLTTINNIIEISKIDSDQITVHTSQINSPEVMDFYYHFFKPQAREKNIDLRLNHTLPQEKEVFMADKFIFDNILTNLLNNAIKFTQKGYVEFGNSFENNNLIFYVKDTGAGIPEDRQEAIFDRFVQANLNNTRPHEGSGLGLSIVKAYVKALNGQIWMESEMGKGTTFYFSIPFIAPNSKEEVSAPENDHSRITNKKLCIVVAEDDNISFLFINQILKRPEIQIIRAKTGQECVDILQKKSGIDLVLMDIKMPVMNGIEATSAIREFNKTVPIIIQTAYTSSRDKDEAMEAGGTDYITKPIDKDRLLQLIRKYT